MARPTTAATPRIACRSSSVTTVREFHQRCCPESSSRTSRRARAEVALAWRSAVRSSTHGAARSPSRASLGAGPPCASSCVRLRRLTSSLGEAALRLEVTHHADGLDIHELAQAELAQLSTVAARLDTTERETRVGRDHPVDEDTARLELTGKSLRLHACVRPRARAQPKSRRIGDTDGVVDVARAE